MGTPLPKIHHLGSGFAVAWPGSVHVDDPALAVELDLGLEVEDGRLVIIDLAAERRPGGPPITIDSLKGLPLVGLVARAISDGPLDGLVTIRSTAGKGSQMTPATLNDLRKLPELEAVAVVYRFALFLGLPPTATVASGLAITRALAAKRVSQARSEALLSPTKPGQKGG